jgi:hypothetical protein
MEAAWCFIDEAARGACRHIDVSFMVVDLACVEWWGILGISNLMKIVKEFSQLPALIESEGEVLGRGPTPNQTPTSQQNLLHKYQRKVNF